MRADNLIKALKKKFGVTTDTALQKELGLSAMTLQNWRKKKLTPRIIAAQVYRQAKDNVSGDAVVEQLHKKLGTKSLEGLAKHFGVTLQAVQYWKNLRSFSAKNTAKIVHSALKASLKAAHQSALRPLVEFFPLSKCESKQGAKFEMFSVKSAPGAKHPYLDGLKQELEAKHGVYVFFDSRGQAIYAGKARKQSLWKEMTNAFNRKRGEVQKIWRVKHPSRKQKYRTSNEKARQPDEYVVPIHELAAYFSAYEVVDGMVSKVEALLVRAFANNLLNKRMETFGKKVK